MLSASKPSWQQVTALVSLSASGTVTGFSFVPHSPADLMSPTSMPVRLMALERSVQPAASGDAALRSAIVNVASYYLRMAQDKTPAEMEAIIWQHDSVNGVDHGESCAAFASLTLELAAQVVGQQSWVTGGTSYPWPLRKWADVRVDPNPSSPNIISVLQDAEAHGRWHALGDGYQPQPGDWVLFANHVEVVTKYANGTLYTIGGDSLPNFSVNAHEYPAPLAADGVVGFVNNGDLAAAAGAAHSGADGTGAASTGHTAAQPSADSSSAGAEDAAIPGTSTAAGATAVSASVPGAGSAAIPGAAGTGASGGGEAPAPAHRANGSRPQAPASRALPTIPGTPAQAATVASAANASDGAAVPGTPAVTTAADSSHAAHRGHQADAPGNAQAVRHSAAAGGSAHTGHANQPTARAAADADIPGMDGQSEPAATAATTTAGAAAIPGVAQRAPGTATSYRRNQPPQSTAPVQDTSTQQAFIDEVAPGAMATQQKYGIPAAVTIAQAIDESGWGQSVLATQDNNLFGIKGAGPAGSDSQPTQEYENGQWVTIDAAFRVYDNITQSIDDHAELLATSGYYSQAMAQSNDPNAFANALTGVYATNPDYGSDLIQIMRQYDLYGYDAAAAGRDGAASGASDPADAAGTSHRANTASASDPASAAGTSDPASAASASHPANAASTSHPTDAASTSDRANTASTSDPANTASTSHRANTASTSDRAVTTHVRDPAKPTATPAKSARPTARPARPAPQPSVPGLIPTAPATPAPSPTPAAPATPQPSQTWSPAAAGTTPNDHFSGRAASSRARSVSTPQPRARQTPEPLASPTYDAGWVVGSGLFMGTGLSELRRRSKRVPRDEAADAHDQLLSTTVSSTLTAFTDRPPAPERPWPAEPDPDRAAARRYQQRLPASVKNDFVAMARGPLLHNELLYRDIASSADLSWELLAACDWMQCQARTRYSPVHGEKLGARNHDGTVYWSRSEALEQCATDLVDLARAVYGIDLATETQLSVADLARVFAAFRWGGLLKRHRTSAMEFPYSVAGLTVQHMNMRWPNIGDPNTPDKPGARFRKPFGAVPIVLSLHYPATV